MSHFTNSISVVKGNLIGWFVWIGLVFSSIVVAELDSAEYPLVSGFQESRSSGIAVHRKAAALSKRDG